MLLSWRSGSSQAWGVGGVAVEDLAEEVAAVGEQGPAAVGVHGEGVQDVLRDPAGECGGEGGLEGAAGGIGLQPYGSCGVGGGVSGGVSVFDGDADQDRPRA